MSTRLFPALWGGVLAVLLLAGCQLALPGPGEGAAEAPAAAATDAPGGTSPITGDAIAVTTLEAPAAGRSSPSGPDPAATPPALIPAPPAGSGTAAGAAVPPADPVEVVPEALKSPEQLACEKKKGRWSTAGRSGVKACVFVTRDGGTQCTKESDCQGRCLARSGTCSPLDPLFGCNEILQDNGARVTLCID